MTARAVGPRMTPGEGRARELCVQLCFGRKHPKPAQVKDGENEAASSEDSWSLEPSGTWEEQATQRWEGRGHSELRAPTEAYRYSCPVLCYHGLNFSLLLLFSSCCAFLNLFFRFTVKLSRRYRDFLYIACPHIYPASPTINIPPTREMHLLNSCWAYTDISQSPDIHNLH